MNRLIITLYAFLHRHPSVGWGAFLASTVLLACSVLTLGYKEDISDFLPVDEANRTALSVYREVSGADNVYVVIAARDTAGTDPRVLTDVVDRMVEDIREADSSGLVAGITAQVDAEQAMEVADGIYADMPFFLTESDYARMDSLLSVPGYVARKIAEDKEMLLFPSSQFLAMNIARDPLDLFSPVLRRLSCQGMPVDYETYDGYLLSPDRTKAIVIVRSSSGASESEDNARLLSLLDGAVARAEAANPDVDVHVTGGPAMAVANAGRIRQDSLLAVALSGVLVLALLAYVFRNARNILLIFVSVGWGWLFAMGSMALLYDSVSVIVLGIASVILGIAVNYPLHLIDHLRECEHPRTALREIVSPLIVGNVTTVGAFLCVVPLNAPALHDLGVFSSLLLTGTIVFVLIFLPHAVRMRSVRDGHPSAEAALITRLAGISLENRPWIVRAVLLLTVVFGCFSLRTEFDSDMRNINYMTDEQKADMDYFNALFDKSTDMETAYLVSSGPDWQKALEQNELVDASVDSMVWAGMARRLGNVSAFLMSRQVQAEKLERWQAFLHRHGTMLQDGLAEASRTEGFSAMAFSPFVDMLSAEYHPRDFEHFRFLASTVFSGNVSEDSSGCRKSIVQTLELRPADMESLRQAVGNLDGYEGMLFDVRSMNEAMAGTLSDNFNYIGLACGCIVFFFLWFSFGNAELAIASFVPMAVSWLWILGIMAVLGIRFNIVNIILATFIFGQGDDYTIFMTEGLAYEHAYRRKLLASYKNSIVVSALIMFIGMGTLNLAMHPALRSLGEVVVVGMSSVVLMAYLFPPLIFNWLVRSGGRTRPRPVTIGRLLRTSWCIVALYAVVCVAYAVGAVMFGLAGTTFVKRRRYRRFLSSLMRVFFRTIPGVRLAFDADGVVPQGDAFANGTSSVLYYPHRSPWDCLLLMAFSPDIIIAANTAVPEVPLLGRIMRWGGHVFALEGVGRGHVGMTDCCPDACIIATDSCDDAVALAAARHGRVRSLYVIGTEHVMPRGGCMVCSGPLYIGTGNGMETIGCPDDGGIVSSAAIVRQYDAVEAGLRRQLYDIGSLVALVFDRYRYKGREVETLARRNLHSMLNDNSWLRYDVSHDTVITLEERGQGEIALMLALRCPEKEIRVIPASSDVRDVLQGCIDGFVDNIIVLDCSDCQSLSYRE